MNPTVGSKKHSKAQTAIELAVFGSVIIFLMGLIVRAVLGTSYQQGSQLKALRLAMLTSFEYSEGIKAPPGDWRDGTTSRNAASVLIIEDRLSASSAKFATVDRTPILSQGTATHSRNLFMPVEIGEYANIPIADFFVNGVHIPLTLGGFVTHPLDDVVFRQRFNHEATDFRQCSGNVNSVFEVVNGTTWYRFDLDHSGGVPNDGVDDTNCDDFFWQWHAGDPSRIDPETGEWTNVDVDADGYPEQVLRVNGAASVTTLDYQEGDIYFSNDPSVPAPGFGNQEVQMFTFSDNPLGTGDGVGTYLRVDEGRLFSPLTGRYARDAQRKDSVDIIQRTLQLTKNTERFCTNAGVLVTAGTPEGNRAGWTAATPNPVEVCCSGSGCCFGPVTITQTCMVYDQPYPLIYVRSRIVDKHGRKYITPTDSDPVVNFTR
ncbi:MAG: hypothetical protein KC900_05095 [Candidatus Omnitrophica bacterium]|nr:hypothetical protein [Candidatus Omnitrophota bacterium]